MNSKERAEEYKKIKRTSSRLEIATLGTTIIGAASGGYGAATSNLLAVEGGLAGLSTSILFGVASVVYKRKKMATLFKYQSDYSEHNKTNSYAEVKSERCIKKCPYVKNCIKLAVELDPGLTTRPKSIDDVATMQGEANALASEALANVVQLQSRCVSGPSSTGVVGLNRKVICSPILMEDASNIMNRIDQLGLDS